MRRLVDTVHVDVLGKDVEVKIFDTIPEEVMSQRYAGEFELNGEIYEVRGPYSTSCQIDAAHIVTGKLPAEFPTRRKSLHVLPPYHNTPEGPSQEEQEGEESSVA